MADTSHPLDLSVVLQKALDLAKIAGSMIKQAWTVEKEIDFKGVTDLVTKTDKEVEKFLIEQIKQSWPDHGFLAEESYVPDTTNESGSPYHFTNAPTWIIDPIDGTTNFVHRYPFVCVSIGFAINKEVVVGVVYNPILDELYHAMKGSGAFLNNKPIRVAAATTIDKAVVATNVGYDRTEEGANFMTGNIKGLLLNNVRSLRSEGSAAVDLCGVACGRLDAFYEFGIHPWDIAAGYLIVQEAKGVMLDPLNAEPLSLECRRVLAGNPQIVQQIYENVLKKTPVPSKYAKILKFT